MTEATSPFAVYEALIAQLCAGINTSGRVISDLRTGRHCRERGASGQMHQIDVAFVDRTISPNHLVIVECKHLRRLVNVGVVKIAKATKDDILATGNWSSVDALVVSTVGFQRGAARLAHYWGIDLVELPATPPYRFPYKDFAQVVTSDTWAVEAHGI